MENTDLLKKEICLGNLIWIRPPCLNFDEFFARGLLYGLGFEKHEIIYLSANHFMQVTDNDFLTESIKSPRVILIGDLINVSDSNLLKLADKLSKSKTFKHRFDLSLIVVSALESHKMHLFQSLLAPEMFQVVESNHSAEADGEIHEMIEAASVEFGKSILNLSVEVADFLEFVYFRKKKSFLRKLIRYSVKNSKNKKLTLVDFGAAFQKTAKSNISERAL